MSDRLPSRFQLCDTVAYAGKRAEVRGVSFVMMDFEGDDWGPGGKVTYDC